MERPDPAKNQKPVWCVCNAIVVILTTLELKLYCGHILIRECVANSVAC